MTKRNYNQFCPLAYSLDLIGDRWTLLIIREMVYGPRRYKDLLDALPGIGTNLLAARLKELEGAEIIRHRLLPPPAGSQVYELTEHGQGLIHPMLELARWGLALLPIPAPDSDQINASAVLTAFMMFFKADLAQNIHITAEFHTDNEVFHIIVSGDQLRLSYGETAQPSFRLQSDMRTLLMLAGGWLSLDMAIDSRQASLQEGSLDTVTQFLGLFSAQNVIEFQTES